MLLLRISATPEYCEVPDHFLQKEAYLTFLGIAKTGMHNNFWGIESGVKKVAQVFLSLKIQCQNGLILNLRSSRPGWFVKKMLKFKKRETLMRDLF